MKNQEIIIKKLHQYKTIPYPKNNQGVDLMLRSPGEVDEKILEGVGVILKK